MYLKAAIDECSEEKFHDAGFSDFGVMGVDPITTNGVMWSLTRIPQGSSRVQRIGSQVTVRNFEIRISLYPDSNVKPAEPAQQYRFVMFKWYGNTDPTTADVLQNTNQFFVVDSPINHDKASKMDILMDSIVPVFHDRKIAGYVSGDTFSIVENMPYVKVITIDLEDESRDIRKVNYLGTTTDAIGHFYMLVVSSVYTPYTLTDPVHYNAVIRCNYTDI